MIFIESQKHPLHFFVGSSFGNVGNAQDYPHLVHLQIKSEAETEHIIVSFS